MKKANIMIINFTKIKHNLRIIKKITTSEIIVVMKANAYGLKANKVIPFLRKEGVAFFAFNEIKEYQSVEKLLVGTDVLIMSSVDKYVIPHVIYTINSYFDALKLVNSYLPFRLRVHLQIDTGMNRYGIRSLVEAKRIIMLLASHPKVSIEGIYTHFSSSCDEMDYYLKQCQIFKNFQKLYHFKTVHASASASINKIKVGNYVRVGLSLYGLDVNPHFLRAIDIKTTLTNCFKTRQLTGISYHQQYFSTNHETIGVANIGYYDGFSGKYLYYKDKRLPVIGSIGMNHVNILLPFKIKCYTRLNIFPKSDKIYTTSFMKQQSMHQLLTAFKAVPKIYVEYRSKNDISSANQKISTKSDQGQTRKRSDSPFSFRTIKL